MQGSGRFIVLSGPRSGNNLLVGLLNRHPALHCFGEALDKNFDFGALARSGQPGELAALAAERRSAPAAFLARLWDSAPAGTSAVGFRIFPGHFERFGRFALRHLPALPDLKVILLHRENPLARFLSLQQAKASDIWVERRAAEAPPLPLTPDPAALLRLAARDERQRARLAALFPPERCFPLSYEALAADWAGVMPRLFAFLGLPPAAVAPRTARQASFPAETLILNRTALHQALTATPLARWRPPAESARLRILALAGDSPLLEALRQRGHAVEQRRQAASPLELAREGFDLILDGRGQAGPLAAARRAGSLFWRTAIVALPPVDEALLRRYADLCLADSAAAGVTALEAAAAEARARPRAAPQPRWHARPPLDLLVPGSDEEQPVAEGMLRSVTRQRGQPFHLQLPATALPALEAALEAEGMEGLRSLRSATCLPGAAGRERLARLGTGAVLVFAAPDIRLEPRALRCLADALSVSGAAAVAAGSGERLYAVRRAVPERLGLPTGPDLPRHLEAKGEEVLPLPFPLHERLEPEDGGLLPPGRRLLWRLDPADAARALTPAGHAALEGGDPLQIVSRGEDPILLLPSLALPPGPCRLVLWLDLELAQAATLQLFWQTPEEPRFSQAQSQIRRLAAGRRQVSLVTPPIRPQGRLRLDPMTAPGRALLHGLTLEAAPV